MSIDGTYPYVGIDMLLQLQIANQDKRIDRSEIPALRNAAHADGVITSGEADLLQKLELATQDGQSVSNFQTADFNPNTLEFNALNLHVQNNQGVIFPDQQLLQRKGAYYMKRCTDLMDLGLTIDRAHSSNLDAPAYFKRLAELTASHADALAKDPGWAQKLVPPSPTTVQHEQNISLLARKLAEIQSHWAVSTDPSRGKEDVQKSAGLIRDAQALLRQIAPELMGPDSHSRLSQLLQAQADLVSRYDGEHKDNPAVLDLIWPDEALGQFVMRKTSAADAAVPKHYEPTGPKLVEADRLQNFREINMLSLWWAVAFF